MSAVATSPSRSLPHSEHLNPIGVASFTTSNLGDGLHTITALYSGDKSYSPTASKGVSIAVGTSAQVKMVRFVDDFQNNLGIQISQPQVNKWLAA